MKQRLIKEGAFINLFTDTPEKLFDPLSAEEIIQLLQETQDSLVISKLFQCHDTLQRILPENTVALLKALHVDYQPQFIESLFGISDHVLLEQILKNNDLHALIPNNHTMYYIDTLLKLPSTLLKTIITNENREVLLKAAGTGNNRGKVIIELSRIDEENGLVPLLSADNLIGLFEESNDKHSFVIRLFKLSKPLLTSIFGKDNSTKLLKLCLSTKDTGDIGIH